MLEIGAIKVTYTAIDSYDNRVKITRHAGLDDRVRVYKIGVIDVKSKSPGIGDLLD